MVCQFFKVLGWTVSLESKKHAYIQSYILKYCQTWLYLKKISFSDYLPSSGWKLCSAAQEMSRFGHFDCHHCLPYFVPLQMKVSSCFYFLKTNFIEISIPYYYYYIYLLSVPYFLLRKIKNLASCWYIYIIV